MSARYWLQNADLSSSPDTPIASALDVLKAFDEYDWAAQWNLQEKLERDGEVFGAPGMGIVRKTGIILHLCPYRDGTVFGFWHTRTPKKVMKIFPGRDNHIQRVNDLRLSIARLAVIKFIEGDDDWMRENFKD